MTSGPRLLGLDASANIRLAIAVLCLLLGFNGGEFDGREFIKILPWVLLVLALDVVVKVLEQASPVRREVTDGVALAMLALAAAVSGAAFSLLGTPGALLILIPTFHAGIRHGRVGFLLACVLGSIAFAFTTAAFTSAIDNAVSFLTWMGSALVIGVLGTLNQRLITAQHPDDHDPAALEAIELIGRLQDLAGRMSTGLDAPAGASLVLDLLAAEVPSVRSAVLVTTDAEHLVPVALRGSTRAPWHLTDDVTAILRTHPASWAPTQISYTDDFGDRVALLIPFALGKGSTTVLVAERPDDQPFTGMERAVANRLVRRVAPTLYAGLLFGSLRQIASLEERNRIARDIHDGIAQELAALGYSIDALRAKAGPPGTGLRDDLDTLRGRLGEAMADLRLHITDLRVAERPETGLGAILGAAVQSFGSVTGVRTTMTVSEGRRRLDPRVELLVHRVVMDVLADAQASGARNAWVTLSTSLGGPARVEIAHDGEGGRSRRVFTDPALAGLDAELDTLVDRSGRTTVSLVVRERGTVDTAAR